MYEIATLPTPIIPKQADTDEQVLAMWLEDRPATTRRIYQLDIERFLAFVQNPLRGVTRADVQGYKKSLKGDEDGLSKLAPATQARMLASVKSLFTYACGLGYLVFNPAAAVALPKLEDRLSERILDEESVIRMIGLEQNTRNHCMLRLFYASGIRVSELCGLTWKKLEPREDGGGQVVVFGKGSKTRRIFLPQKVWDELVALRGDVDENQPVFPSQNRGVNRGGFLTTMQVTRIVRAAAQRAGIKKKVSPHWLRHAHASHALDNHAPVHLVASTLGHASLATTSRYTHAKQTESSANYLRI